MSGFSFCKCECEYTIDTFGVDNMDGFTTFEKLQANRATQTIPVILLTAKIQASDRRRYAQKGMTAAIAKPFNPLELAGQIAAALGWSLD